MKRIFKILPVDWRNRSLEECVCDPSIQWCVVRIHALAEESVILYHLTPSEVSRLRVSNALSRKHWIRSRIENGTIDATRTHGPATNADLVQIRWLPLPWSDYVPRVEVTVPEAKAFTDGATPPTNHSIAQLLEAAKELPGNAPKLRYQGGAPPLPYQGPSTTPNLVAMLTLATYFYVDAEPYRLVYIDIRPAQRGWVIAAVEDRRMGLRRALSDEAATRLAEMSYDQRVGWLSQVILLSESYLIG
jgi:hypothetical protein